MATYEETRKIQRENEIAYLRENIHYLENMELDKILLSVNQRRMSKDLGAYVDHGTIAVTRIKPDLSRLDYDLLLFQTKAEITKRYGTYEQFLEYYHTERLFTSYGFRRDGNEKFYLHGGGALSALFYVLDYVINGELSEDYQRAHEIMAKEVEYQEGIFKRNRIELGETVIIQAFGGISIRWYQKGTMAIKGLSRIQIDKLDQMIEYTRKHQNV